MSRKADRCSPVFSINKVTSESVVAMLRVSRSARIKEDLEREVAGQEQRKLPGGEALSEAQTEDSTLRLRNKDQRGPKPGTTESSRTCGYHRQLRTVQV